MLKCMDRFVPDTEFTDECEPNKEEMTFAWTPEAAKHFSANYVQQMIIHYGAVEFKTLKDIYEKEE